MHRAIGILLGGLTFARGVAACAVSHQPIAFELPDGSTPSEPFFTPPADDAGDAGPGVPMNPLLCIATACPAPYDTCGAGERCSTNLSNDPKNCGACGSECLADFVYLNMTSTCVNGACEPLCLKKPAGGGFDVYADCNKVLEDGCEVSLSTDPNNCGACGTKCDPGVRCIGGKCGCPPGTVDCSGRCIDVRHDDFNCGACGNVCQTPADAGAPPPNMVYGCVDNQCGKPKCIDGWGETWADCDGNLANGCETFIGISPETDPNKCGACGNKCAPHQVCADIDMDFVAECICTKPNETLCGSEPWDFGCYDLLNDVKSCGTCFRECRADTERHLVAACRKGVCERDCAPGWGDCDGDPSNGCESNLKTNDVNCGACGNRCDTQAGQPCVEGQCVMTTECDAGRGPQ